MPDVPEYRWHNAQWGQHTRYLLKQIEPLAGTLGAGVRVLDIGSGNGAVAGWFHSKGCEVVGIEPSSSGIEQARAAHPGVRFEQMVVHPGLLDDMDEPPFDLVVSTEVVEHLYAPGQWCTAAFNAVAPGGVLIATTPYHGWLKNVLVAVTNKFDRHVNVLRDGGHIKFFSPMTLTTLFQETGFIDITWRGAGRLPLVWKSMVMRGTRPDMLVP